MQVKTQVDKALKAADWETATECSIREAVAAEIGECTAEDKQFIKVCLRSAALEDPLLPSTDQYRA